jgi:hypothetical protein
MPAEPDKTGEHDWDRFDEGIDYYEDTSLEAPSPKSLSSDALITEHIQSLATLRGDIETMLRKEGRRSFWNGVWTNAVFFVLGLVCAAVPLSSGDVFAFLRR